MAGPSIATATVTVDLDGRRIPAEAKALGEETGAAMGDEHAKAFDEHASKGVDEYGKNAESDLREHGKKSGEGFGDELEKGLEPSLARVRRDLSVPFQEAGGDVRTLGGDVGQLGEDFDGLGTHIDGSRGAFSRARGDIEDFDAQLGPTGDHMETLRGRTNSFRTDVEKVSDPVQRLKDYLEKIGVGASNLEEPLKRAAGDVRTLGADVEGSGVKVERTRGVFRRFFDAVKNAFDKVTIAGGKAIAQGFDDIGGSAKNAEGPVKGLGDTLRAPFTGNAGYIAGIVALVIGFLPQLAVLAGAATGGLLILSGAAVAAGLAVGGLVLGFSNIVQPLKDLPAQVQPAASAIQGLVGGFREVGNKLVFIPGAIQGVRDALQVPLFEGLATSIEKLNTTLIPSLIANMGTLGGALNTVLTGFVTDLNSSGFAEDLKAIFDGAKPVIIDLGDIARNTFGIIGQLLIDVLPSVHDFTGGVADATGKFLDFLRSPEGKTAVQDFLANAKKTLKEVGDVLVDVGGQIAGLITPENVAKTISDLNSLSDAAQKLVAFSDKISPVTSALVGLIGVIADFAAGVATAFGGFLAAGDSLLIDFQLFLSGMISAAISGGKAIGEAIGGTFDGIHKIMSGDIVGGVKEIRDSLDQSKKDFKAFGENVAASMGNTSAAFDTLPTASKKALEGMATNFHVHSKDVKDFGGVIATVSAASGVSIEDLAKAKGWSDLASISGLSQTKVDQLRQQFEDTSKKSQSALDKLSSSAQKNLSGVDKSMGATGTANDVLKKAFTDQADGSKKALQGLADAKSYGDIQKALGLTGKASKTDMADRIATAAAESGLSIDKLPPKIQSLINKYGDIPKDVKTNVVLTGSALAIEQADAVAARLKSLNASTATVTIVSNQIAQGHAGGALGGVIAGGQYVQGGRAFAEGGLLSTPTWFGNALAGESGVEAIVPLSKPLYQVDPSVRNLSAFAQGLGMNATSNKPGAYVAPGAIQVITPSENPSIVAEQVMDRLVPQL